MDGTLAAIFIIAGMTDMGLNDCATACLGQSDATARINAQVGDVIFQEDNIGHEAYFAYDLPRKYGPFQPTVGGSIADDGAVWVGAGAKWNTRRFSEGPLFLEASLMPGLYAQNDGPDLGGALQFRSALGLGYTFANDATLTVLYDHRSNADTQDLNPGLETLSLRYAFVFK